MKNYKINIVFILCSLVFLGVIGKLIFIQIIDSEIYIKRAEKQIQSQIPLYPLRGEILDRNRNLLAYSIKTYKLSADIFMIKDSEYTSVANRLAYITKKNPSSYLELLRNASGRIAVLEKELTSAEIEKIIDLDINGLIIEEKSKRIYSFGNFASHILGYVNSESEGLDGIELQYDKYLRGEEGYNVIQKDAFGRLKTVVKHKSKKVKNGNRIILTLDREIQLVLEQELAKGVISSKASTGSGIIIDPNSGEILALANYPAFDPNEYFSASVYNRRNRAVTDMYEPGSTFKVVTMSGIIEDSVYNQYDYIYAENGSYKIYNVNITDSHPLGNITILEAIQQSSNIAFAKMAMKLGASSMYKYVRDFGFGNITGIDLPGEAKGNLKKVENWDRLTLPFIAHGYSIAVTPIQLIYAYAAAINGGKLIKPHLVKKIETEEGDEIKKFETTVTRQIISENTSNVIRKMLRHVVENGTGTKAKIEGVVCGGKTGTAQKLIDGKYSKQYYISSFAGFYPVDNPNLLCLIVIDSPEGQYYGGQVAAPIFSNVGKRIFINNNQEKLVEENFVYHTFDKELVFPNLIGKEKNQAMKIARSFDTPVKYTGNGNLIVSQIYDEKENSLTLRLGNLEPNRDLTQVPNVVGLSLREAINQLSLAQLKVNFEGTGYVVQQSIEAGKNVSVNSVCKLICSKEL